MPAGGAENIPQHPHPTSFSFESVFLPLRGSLLPLYAERLRFSLVELWCTL